GVVFGLAPPAEDLPEGEEPKAFTRMIAPPKSSDRRTISERREPGRTSSVGGEPSRARRAGKAPEKKTVVAFSFERVAKLGGLDVPEAKARDTLAALGFGVEGKGKSVKVTAPSWRPDVHGSADIVEEVVRIAGLDTIPSAALPKLHGVTRSVLTEKQRRTRRARRLLASRGMVEAITWSFIERKDAALFGGGSDALELANPISSDMSSMRPTLLVGLLTGAQRNRNRGFSDVALFEIGQVFRGDRPEDQGQVAAGVRAGAAGIGGAGRDWLSPAKDAGLFDAKADAAALLSVLGVDVGKVQITRDAPGWYHPGRSGVIRLGPKTVLAQFGELHPDTLAVLDVAAPAVAFEGFLDAVPAARRKGTQRPPLDVSDLQPVRRDFAFILGSDVAAADVIRAASGADKKLITAVSVFDQFEGASLGAGKKSLAIEVVIQPRDEPLKDEAIDAIAKKVIAEVKRVTGGEVRGG
ncbi:MAG TPA: hypothetical protein PK264_18585, partial [Hyphomicrobiaceae bacterium]|nr:hypothetical protein [Hyphomicrobiaceae bacterium]